MSLLDGLPTAAAARVRALGRAVALQPSDCVVRQGEPSRECYLVLDGKATVAIDGIDVGVAGPGDAVGELGLLHGSPRSATVVADTAMTVLAFDEGAFHQLVDEVPVLRRRLTAKLVRRLQETSEWGVLAADADLYFNALLSLQEAGSAEQRARAREDAAELVSQAAGAGPAADDHPLTALTAAEQRVADLVAEGLPNKDIAERLFVSRHTVESHLKHIYVKLGLRSRVELAALVVRAGRSSS
jgi:CRP-like cAMP-binding protein